MDTLCQYCGWHQVRCICPKENRGFVHKRIFGGIKGAIGGILGGPTGVLGGAIGGFVGAPKGTALVPATRAGCPPGFAKDTFNNCVSTVGRRIVFDSQGNPVVQPLDAGLPLTRRPFPRDITTPVPGVGFEKQLTLGGDAELGRFGAGINPAFFSQQHRRCPRGMVLGAPEADGESLCYNKRDLSNKERMWPRGRRPLLTGGEMRAISTASSAAKKLQRKQKQLESLGLLKRPAARGRRAAPAITAAGHKLAVVHE